LGEFQGRPHKGEQRLQSGGLSLGSNELTQFGNVEGVPARSHRPKGRIRAGGKRKTPQSDCRKRCGCEAAMEGGERIVAKDWSCASLR
jgi:hypothetical protein